MLDGIAPQPAPGSSPPHLSASPEASSLASPGGAAEQFVSILSATVEAHCDSSERPTHDLITVVFSTDGKTTRTTVWHWIRGNDIATVDMEHGSWLWDELHDAAIQAADSTALELAAINAARAADWARLTVASAADFVGPRISFEPRFFDERMPSRFWDKVQPCPISGCWIWFGPQAGFGYGRFSLGRRDEGSDYPHRLVMRVLCGVVPARGEHVDHLCRNRLCCNPVHLQVVSHRVNCLRGEGFTAQHAKATHCPQGHPYDAENTYLTSAGRHCRKCRAKASARSKAKARAGAARRATSKELPPVSLEAERHAAAYQAYVAACAAEDERRALRDERTVRIPHQTLAEIAHDYYARLAVAS